MGNWIHAKCPWCDDEKSIYKVSCVQINKCSNCKNLYKVIGVYINEFEKYEKGTYKKLNTACE